MRNKMSIKMIRGFILTLILATAVFAMPHALMAEPDEEATLDTTESMQAFAAQSNTYIIQFHPQPGEFPYPETTPDNTGRGGVRVATRNTYFDDFPPDPYLPGQTFTGWLLSTTGEMLDGSPIMVDDHFVFVAQWVPYDGESTNTDDGGNNDAATASPSPSPSPAPGTTSPSPTPYAPRPGNPQTSPIAVSFLIFGAVMALGFSAFAIIKLMARQALATGQYNKKNTRYEREARLTSFLEKDE